MLAIILCIVLLKTAVYCHNPTAYSLSEPKFHVFRPNGFRVIVPHVDGVTLFAFHGNVNEPIKDLAAGQISTEVWERTGDKWIIEVNSTRLQTGDKIYYWLFIIRNNLGYRYDDGCYVVKELEHRNVTMVSKNHEEDDDSHPIKTGPVSMKSICESIVLNLTRNVLDLQNKLESLEEINGILTEIAEKHPASTKSFKIEGRIPTTQSPLITVQDIVRNKLALSINIVDAKRNSDKSISFEVSNLEDKLTIIKAAKRKLKHSKIYLSY